MWSWNRGPPRQGNRTTYLDKAEEQNARLELLYPADGAANAVVEYVHYTQDANLFRSIFL